MTTENPTPDMSPADIAWLMNAIWASLQSPDWRFSNRKDLEQLGTAIYSGKKLKELDPQLLNRLFPHIKTITLHLANLLTHHVPRPVAAPAQAAEPAPANTQSSPDPEPPTTPEVP
jgi:hypothetical protein